MICSVVYLTLGIAAAPVWSGKILQNAGTYIGGHVTGDLPRTFVTLL